jgi:hypothetical protein
VSPDAATDIPKRLSDVSSDAVSLLICVNGAPTA